MGVVISTQRNGFHQITDEQPCNEVQGQRLNQVQGQRHNEGQGQCHNEGQGQLYNKGQGQHCNEGQGQLHNKGQGQCHNEGQGQGQHHNESQGQRCNESQGQMAGMNQQKDKHIVVVAMDFGTVHSGFAYSFKGHEETISSGEHGGVLQHDRVPTILLLNPNKTFHSFGYKAQTNYNNFSKRERSKFYYFENFKMKIYENNKIESNMVINDVSGKPLEAMTVFTTAIKHLKEEALTIVHESKIGLKDTDIQWMLTIPAISSDSARQFMREASTKAGILESHLRLVLESEAAALYSKPRVTTEEMPSGFKYVLADLGGGTSDICAHKTIDCGKIQEIYRVTGEAYGGTDVDMCFINMMESLTGQDVWRQFLSEYSSAYTSLVDEFRFKKKEFQSSTNAISLKMENALVHVVSEKLNTNLHDIIKRSQYTGKLEYQPIEGRLILYRKMLEELFMPSVDKIVGKISEVLDNCADSGIKTVILVGGYSESPYLRERIKSKLRNVKVILIDAARLAVLNGAVMMGWKPRNIVQRKSRYTYGFSMYDTFQEGRDPEDLKIIFDGKAHCNKAFKKMINNGQIVEYGQKFQYKGQSTSREPALKHRKKYIKLYGSTLENPRYCTEEHGCSLLGKIVLTPPTDGWPDAWESDLHLIVGETELTVKYFNLTTGEEYAAQTNFL